MKSAQRVIGALLLAGALAAQGTLSAQTGGLTGAPQIARVYDAILDARFDQVPGLLQQTCNADRGSPPRERPHRAVCQLLDTVALWWQIQLDPLNTSRDASFEAKADDVVTAMEEWTRAEPEQAEAWFYLGGVYGARAQFRVLRGHTLSAARDGKRIKDALERALALDPNLEDAYFGIGLYHYYADVAPAAAKVLRFLLFLPGGDKVQGLREMRQAREGGQLLRSEADYQLHLIYLWYEDQPQRARDLIVELRDRHPANPHFPQVVAEIDDAYLHDDTASLRSWQAMLAAAQSGRLALAPMAEARARLGLAVQLDRLFETDAALEQLQSVIRSAPAAPFAAVAQATLQRAQALDRMGRRAEALESYRLAIAAAGPEDRLKIADRARAGIRNPPDVGATRSYRLSIEGWRAMERGALAEASQRLIEALELRPNDPVIRYRLARVRLAQKNPEGALTLLEQVAAARTTTPPTFYGYVCLDAAGILEQQGSRSRAIEFYTRAAGVFGADQRTKAAAARALARLSGRALTPSA